MIIQTDWIEIKNPTSIPISEFRIIPFRQPSIAKIQKLANSFRQRGIAPTPVRVAYGTWYNDKSDPNPHYWIIDGGASFLAAQHLGLDPRERLEFWQLPEDKATKDEITRLIVKLNRAQKQATLKEVVTIYADINADYAQIASFMRTYRYASPLDIAVMLNPADDVDVTENNLDNGTYTITNPTRGPEAIKFFNSINRELDADNRPLWLNPGFARELGRRFQAHPNFVVDYVTGYPPTHPSIPAGPNISGVLPIGVPAVVGGVLLFSDVITGAICNDLNFPRIPWNKRIAGDRNVWNNTTLDLMGIPR